jgi:hypothetical protein
LISQRTCVLASVTFRSSNRPWAFTSANELCRRYWQFGDRVPKFQKNLGLPAIRVKIDDQPSFKMSWQVYSDGRSRSCSFSACTRRPCITNNPLTRES